MIKLTKEENDILMSIHGTFKNYQRFIGFSLIRKTVTTSNVVINEKIRDTLLDILRRIPEIDNYNEDVILLQTDHKTNEASLIYIGGVVAQYNSNDFTWRHIYNQFMIKTGIHPHKVKDYRPCVDMFDVPNIPESIVVWLKDGGRIIYTYDKSEGPHSTEYPL